MKEATFLQQNSDKWQAFEELLAESRKSDPDSLSDLYVHLMEDLSYARTNYPGSRTEQYLNALATRVHREIYRNRKEQRGRIIRFWSTEVPLLFGQYRSQVLYSFLVFFLALFIGIVSTANDDMFVRLILGDRYVDMTLQNIDQGDPLAIYKQVNEVDMFVGITVNNVLVSFRAFVFGIFLSIGTGYVLFVNGVMVGAFQYFFHEHDLLIESMRTIWIHGTLEISAIVMAGAAGLVMGNGILFPGTYSRLESFVRGARAGVKMVIGLVPIFVTAGFLEAFVTRHTDMPLLVSLAIIGGSLAFVIWYFVLYPRTLLRESQ